MDEEKKYVIIISEGVKFIVGIRYNGTVEYGDGVDLDTASRLFWDTISQLIRNTPIT